MDGSRSEPWIRSVLLVGGAAVTACGVIMGFLGRASPTVIGTLVTGLVLLLLVAVEGRLEEISASWGDKASLKLKLKEVQVVAGAARDRAEVLTDPQQLRDAIRNTSAAIDDIAKTFTLSGPRIPEIARELASWPFASTALPEPDGRVRVTLVSVGGVEDTSEPIDVMCVVKDSRDRTFVREVRLNTVVKRHVASFEWPHDFTSDDFADGDHHVDWFVAPISVGPRRRFHHAAQVTFTYRRQAQVGT